jgi:hypothetical protein
MNSHPTSVGWAVGRDAIVAGAIAGSLIAGLGTIVVALGTAIRYRTIEPVGAIPLFVALTTPFGLMFGTILGLFASTALVPYVALARRSHSTAQVSRGIVRTSVAMLLVAIAAAAIAIPLAAKHAQSNGGHMYDDVGALARFIAVLAGALTLVPGYVAARFVARAYRRRQANGAAL